MKTTNKILLAFSLIFTNGLTHGNNIHSALNVTCTVGLFAGPLIVLLTDHFSTETHPMRPLILSGQAIHAIAIGYLTVSGYNKQITLSEKTIDIQEKNYKINQELLAIQEKNYATNQEILKKLEKKEAEQTT